MNWGLTSIIAVCTRQKAAALHTKLGENDKRPVSPKHGTVLPIIVPTGTASAPQNIPPYILPVILVYWYHEVCVFEFHLRQPMSR